MSSQSVRYREMGGILAESGVAFCDVGLLGGGLGWRSDSRKCGTQSAMAEKAI